MKRLSKQVLALVLSVCLLLGVFPALPASADEGTESGITRAQMAVSVYNWFLPTASGNDVSFSDIEECTKEQQAAILTLAKVGIVEGTEENTFSPDDTVTRAQAAVVLYRAMGGTPDSAVNSDFNDIENLNEEFRNAINYLAAQNVLQASDATEGKFVPNGAITQETLDTWLSRISVEGHFTRADLAVMVCEAFDLTATGDASFNDISDLDENVQDAILTLANLGIVSGTADSDGKSFDPQGLVSRMAAAVTIYRVYEKTTEVGSDIPEQTLFTDVSLNVMPTVFNLLVFKGVLSEEDIVYSTGEDRGLYLLNAMANRTTVQGWLNKAAAELNPAQGHTVTVNVTGESEAVSYTVNWYQNGNKLPATENSITVTDTSVPLYYEVVLTNEALKQYSMTNGSGAVEFSDENTTEITVTLASHQTVSVKGTVQNENKAPISGATVTITQNYSASVSEQLASVSTDESGEFTISGVKTVPSVLKISAPGYYDYSTAVSFSEESSGTIDLETVQLSPLPDSKVTLSLSFQAAVGSGQTPTTTSLSSFANLEFTVHKGDSEVTDFAAQYPYLVFDKDSGVSGGDTLTISVTDASGKAAMSGGAVEVKLNSDGSGLAELTLVENGKIAINALTGVDQGTVMVFDDGENLVSSGAAWGAYTSPSLPDGTYTVVALEKTDLIQSVSSLSQLSELGLASNNYVQTTATVSNGVITEIDSLTVLELDESAISFTDFASTTVDYVTASVGRNVTLRVEYQLKEQYKSSQVSLTITLPNGLRFDGAPTLNSAVVSSYGNGGNTYTISGTGSGVVRVFLTGATAGSYDISPKLSIAGATNPVGTAHLEITNAQIYVPSTTGKTEPTVSGISAAEGTVTIYVDGEAQQDTVTADKTGAWKTTLSLSDTSYSQHEVYAQIRKDGDTYTTETKTLIYDPDYIDVSKVTMYNVVDDREQEVVFDYNNPYSGSNYFTANDSEFTFVIEFESGKDCSRLANVRLNLFTANGDVYTESAEWMEGTNKYTVVTSGVIPVNVGVEYLCLPAENSDGETDVAAADNFQEIVSKLQSNFSNGLEIKTSKEWTDAAAYWIGPKETTSNSAEGDWFTILLHTLDFESYEGKTSTQMEELGFVEVTGEDSQNLGYGRLTITYDWVQYVLVVPAQDGNTPGTALAISIPVKFKDILENLAKLQEEMDESQKGVSDLLAQAGFAASDTLVSSEITSLLSQETTDLAQVVPFPYQDEKLSDGAITWRKIVSWAEEYMPYNQAIAFVDLGFQHLQVGGERLRIWEEIEYERARIEQLANAESCYGLPLLSKEEYYELWGKLRAIVELEGSIAAYRQDALDFYYHKLVNYVVVGWVSGMIESFEESIQEGAQDLLTDTLFGMLRITVKTYVFSVTKNSKLADAADDLLVATRDAVEGVIEGIEEGENIIEALKEFKILHTALGSNDENMIFGELDGRPYWEETRKNYADLGKLVKRLDDDINEKVKENRKNCPPEPLPNHQDDPAKSPCPDKIYGIDPSGYVYEAVPSNRLEGVTAKILKEDGGSYTEWSEAQQYGGQKSTIATTETGEYRWDVPEGTWKVEFTKEGYDKAEKEGLIVPPPQTDINIGMVSEAVPAVSAAQAYTDGVLVEFSQYMDIESVKESITLVMGGKVVSCTVEPVNAETDTNIKVNSPTYASRFFVKPADGVTLSGEVTVMVSTSAKSYNGKMLGTEYSKQQQVKGVCPTRVEAPGSLSVLVGDSSSLSFTLQPGLANQKLKVEITTPSLVGFAENQTSSVTTDTNGSADVTLKGLLPGTGVVKITHAESGLSTTVKIKIVSTQEQLNAPGTVVAKLANGTTVTDGMTVSKGAQVVLSGSPARVTIQYTLDETCPKTTGAKIYTGPITINQDTTLRAVAKGSDGVFGEVSTWKLKVSGSGSVSGGGTSDKDPESVLPFGDVSEKAWYYSAIEYVYEHDLMAGTSATTFEPNGTLSRGMVAQILYNLEGQPAVTGESTFTDSNTHWAAKAIAWAQQTGVVSGYGNNTFRPNQAVTREELAQMLYNYAAHKDYDLTASGDLTAFPDGNNVQSWAETAMSWANGNKLINGFEDDTLRPGGDSTRAQAASILMNFDLNLVND